MTDSDCRNHVEHVVATGVNGLHRIGGFLHDEYFDVDDIRHDKETCTLEIPFRRIWHDGPRRLIKNRWLYRVEEVDVLRCLLRITNVVSFEVLDRARIGVYSLNRLHYDECRGLITIFCCPDCRLVIAVRQIGAEYEEIEYRGKTEITSGLFWDSNSGEVYEE